MKRNTFEDKYPNFGFGKQCNLEAGQIILNQYYNKHPDKLNKLTKKLKPKHWILGRNFEKHIDRRWYPNYKLEPISLEAFIRFETYGRKVLSQAELWIIEALLDGKENKELNRYMHFEEIAEWWSNGWGWYYPLADIIKKYFKDRNIDKIDLQDRIDTMRYIYKNGMIEFINNFSGFSQEQRNKFFNRKLVK